jgi:DNA polymerase-3 subunit gamma/tau
MIDQPLITKYRPTDFRSVFGHDQQVKALERVIASSSCPHAFLFTGSAGLGKTSLARITAHALQAEILEIDAASNNGVDAVRELTETGHHMALSGNGRRAFIIDECHALSKAAWQALLKTLEEPPSHLFLMLCTTELAKVPETIITRCMMTALRPLPPNEMDALLAAIADAEDFKVNPDVLQAVVQAAAGSPRKGISMLQAVHDVPSREEVKRILHLMDEGDALYDLCKLLVAGKTWAVVSPVLARIDDDAFAGAAVSVGRFLAKAMVTARDEKGALAAWTLLDALLFPSAGYDAKASFYAAVGRMMFGKS